MLWRRKGAHFTHMPAPTPAGGRVPRERGSHRWLQLSPEPRGGRLHVIVQGAAVPKGTEAGAQEVGENWDPGPCYGSLGHCAELGVGWAVQWEQGFCRASESGNPAKLRNMRYPPIFVRGEFCSFHLCSRLMGWYWEGYYRHWPALLPGLSGQSPAVSVQQSIMKWPNLQAQVPMLAGDCRFLWLWNLSQANTAAALPSLSLCFWTL